MRDVYRRFGFVLGFAVLALACGEKDASSTKQDSAAQVAPAATAVPVSDTDSSQDAAEESVPRSNGGRVTATIDGKDYVWDVPTPNTNNCSIWKMYRVSFLSSENDTTIVFANGLVKVTLEDGSRYTHVSGMFRANYQEKLKEDIVTIEGNTVTFEGVLGYFSKGAQPRVVEAKIVAVCPEG